MRHDFLRSRRGPDFNDNLGANFMIAVMTGQKLPVSHEEYFKGFDAVVDCIYIYDELREWYPMRKLC